MDDNTYYTDMTGTNTYVLSDLPKSHAFTWNISSQEGMFYTFGQCLLRKTEMNTQHHDSTKKSVVKSIIINECCVVPQYALTKIINKVNYTSKHHHLYNVLVQTISSCQFDTI